MNRIAQMTASARADLFAETADRKDPPKLRTDFGATGQACSRGNPIGKLLRNRYFACHIL